jgi:hypothetical protein
MGRAEQAVEKLSAGMEIAQDIPRGLKARIDFKSSIGTTEVMP